MQDYTESKKLKFEMGESIGIFPCQHAIFFPTWSFEKIPCQHGAPFPDGRREEEPALEDVIGPRSRCHEPMRSRTVPPDISGFSCRNVSATPGSEAGKRCMGG